MNYELIFNETRFNCHVTKTKNKIYFIVKENFPIDQFIYNNCREELIFENTKDRIIVKKAKIESCGFWLGASGFSCCVNHNNLTLTNA